MKLIEGFNQGSFFGVRIRFLASEGGSLHKYTNQSQSLHKYTNQSQSLHILQPEKRTLDSILNVYRANACYGHPNSCCAEACDGVCICGLGAPR
jgi:hypothetical protein